MVTLVGFGDSGLLYRAVGSDTYAAAALSPFEQFYDVFIQAYPTDPTLPPNPILPYSLDIEYNVVLSGTSDVLNNTATVLGLEEQ